MPTTTSLSLSNILNVSVVVSASGATGPTFSQPLLIGGASVISPSTRLSQFTSLAGMVTAGFSTTGPEYLAAQVMLAQSPAPTTFWIGRQDLTSLQTVTVDAAGSGYVVGDILAVAGGTGGQVKVTSVSSTDVTGVSIYVPGTGYALATGEATTAVTGSGSGCTITITVVGDTPVQALTYCRNANPQWYAAMFVGLTETGIVATTTGTATINTTSLTVASGTGLVIGQIVAGTGVPLNTTLVSGSGTSWVLSSAVTAALSSTTLNFYTAITDADYEAMAAYIQATTPPSVLFLTCSESSVLNNSSGNLFATCQAANYTRTFGLYSTTQGGLYPNNLFASAAPLGYAMGMAQTDEYFDIMFKQMYSIATEPLTQTQVNTISGSTDRSNPGLSGNVYVNYANGLYAWVQNATMFSTSGVVFFDQILFLDMLASAIQYNGVNLLVSIPSLPISDAGVALLANVVSQACTTSQNIGFIAQSGVWNGPTVGPYTAGTPLPKGFAVVTQPVSSLTSAQRAARRLPPMNVILIESESGHTCSITVNVQP